MLDPSRLWRQFLSSPWLQAGAMGLLVTVPGARPVDGCLNYLHGSGLDRV